MAVDQWMLYANPVTYAGRGLAQGEGRVYTEDGRLVASYAVQAMIRGRDFTVKVQSARGNQLTDTYSLTGFTDAVSRAKQECGAG